jgi:hydrogenase maturation protease
MTQGRGAPTCPVADRPLVVGLGSPDRGDDAVGVVVARVVAARHLPRVEVLTHEDPTDLVELWSGRRLVVVVDAVRSGSEPGTLTVLETGTGGQRLPESAWGRTGRGGTHAFGLASAVELARALRRLPDRVVLVGVEAASFDHRAPLSTAVAAAVQHAVDHVLAVVGAPEGSVASEGSVGPEGSTTPEGATRVPG